MKLFNGSVDLGDSFHVGPFKTVNSMLDAIKRTLDELGTATETDLLQFQSLKAEWASLEYCKDGGTKKDRWRRKERKEFLRKLKSMYWLGDA